MKVYSHILTADDIAKAATYAPVSFQNTGSREGWFVPIREFKARDGRRGFEFFLSGSSPYRAQHDREEFAATWTEWGLVIDALFKVDPNAKIGHYDGREEFLRTTDELAWKTRAEKPWLR